MPTTPTTRRDQPPKAPLLYKDEVLGRDVVVQLELDHIPGTFHPYIGTIRQMKADVLEDGSLDIEHCVWFQDGDKIWLDLVLYEENQLFTFIPKPVFPATVATNSTRRTAIPAAAAASKRKAAPKKSQSIKRAKAAASSRVAVAAATTSKRKAAPKKSQSIKRPKAAASSRVAVAAEVTPSKSRPQNKRKTTPIASNQRSINDIVDGDRKAAAVRRPLDKTFVDYTTGKVEDIAEFLKTFREWLMTVPHGDQGLERNVCSLRNTKRILGPVEKLLGGHGIDYANWPSETKFLEGTCVDMKSDFKSMIDQGEEYENVYGADNRGGWGYKHPLKKLFLYQESLRERDLVSQ